MGRGDLKPDWDAGMQPRKRYVDCRREAGMVASASRFLWWSTVKAALKVLNRLEVVGRRHLPDAPPFVLVSNHASHLDTLVLGAALPVRMRRYLFPLAAGDVFFETPPRAAFSATVLNALPLWRNNCGAHAIQDLRNRLIEDRTIFILFPEGGRTRNGEMQPFKPGIGMLTAGTDVPVVPCFVEGTFEAFPPCTRVPRPGKLRLWIGRPRLFADVDNRRRGWDEIARILEADVRRLGGLDVPADVKQYLQWEQRRNA